MLRNNRAKHAWYSSEAAHLGGHSLYLTPDGRKLPVTFVAQDRKAGRRSNYRWPDTRYRGVVKNPGGWLRGVPGRWMDMPVLV